MDDGGIFDLIDGRRTEEVLAAVAARPSLAHARHASLGSTPLVFAAHRGLLEIAGAILEAGADVAALERVSGTTALHWAAEGGHAEIVRRLLAGGADLEVRDEWHQLTPLGWATVVHWNPAFHADRPGTAGVLL